MDANEKFKQKNDISLKQSSSESDVKDDCEHTVELMGDLVGFTGDLVGSTGDTIESAGNMPKTTTENEENLLIGSKINDRYEVKELLGSGGMGAVYRAVLTSINKPVAIKILHPLKIHDSKASKRFEQEAKGASKLQHQNLVGVSDFGFLESGQPFLVMDLIEGEALSAVIHQEGKLSISRAVNIFRQICEALSYAHAKGTVHRDLKPSNIMLIKDDRDHEIVKVVDFGIAKFQTPEGDKGQELTETGEVFGSPLYMSPEQCAGNKLDPRSDIYSLGCVMYETLTGRVPFKGENVLQTIFQHVHDKPASLRSLRSDIPANLETIVMRTLEKELADRYQSADQVLSDLNNFEKEPAAATSKSNKKPSWIFATGIAVVSLFVLFALQRHIPLPLSLPGSSTVLSGKAATADSQAGGNNDAMPADILSMPADARVKKATEFFTQARNCIEKQEYDRAFTLAQQTAALILDLHSQINLRSEAIATLGEIYGRKGDWRNAKKYYQDAIAVRTQDSETPDYITAGFYYELGSVCKNLNELAECAKFYSKNAQALLQNKDSTPQEIVDSLGRAAYSYHEWTGCENLKNLQTAMKLLDQALAYAEKLPKKRKPDMAGCQFILGILTDDFAGYYKGDATWRGKAREHFRIASQCTKDKNVQANALNFLGNSLCDAKKYGEAEKAYRQALNLVEKIDSPTNLGVPSTLLALARVCKLERRNEEAEETFIKALNSFESKTVPCERQKAETSQELGLVQRALTKFDDAARSFQKSASLWQKVEGDGPENAASASKLMKQCQLNAGEKQPD